VNVGGLLFITLGVLILFIGYPIVCVCPKCPSYKIGLLIQIQNICAKSDRTGWLQRV